MHQLCQVFFETSNALTMIRSVKIIFIGLAIAAASAHPYGDQYNILNAPAEESRQRPITFNKHFHFFTAPEEPETSDDIIPESFLQRNIRVVVIKAPENKRITSAITQLAASLAKEKTAIYVLNREPDVTELHSQIKRLREEITERPDVHFIKYKTPEEAELAAINIQSQFEYLTGPSESTSEDAAPLERYDAPLNGEDKLRSSSASGAGPVQSYASNDGVNAGKIDLHVSPSANSVDKSRTALQPGRTNASEVIGLYLPPETSLTVDIRTQTYAED